MFDLILASVVMTTVTMGIFVACIVVFIHILYLVLILAKTIKGKQHRK